MSRVLTAGVFGTSWLALGGSAVPGRTPHDKTATMDTAAEGRRVG